MALTSAMSVAALFAERDALRQRDKQAEEQLQRRRERRSLSSSGSVSTISS